MVLIVRQQKAFVCPEKPEDTRALEEEAKKFKVPPAKKQPQVRVPRGGMRGRSMSRY